MTTDGRVTTLTLTTIQLYKVTDTTPTMIDRDRTLTIVIASVMTAVTNTSPKRTGVDRINGQIIHSEEMREEAVVPQCLVTTGLAGLKKQNTPGLAVVTDDEMATGHVREV